jgi:hypothetical protein
MLWRIHRRAAAWPGSNHRGADSVADRALNIAQVWLAKVSLFTAAGQAYSACTLTKKRGACHAQLA